MADHYRRDIAVQNITCNIVFIRFAGGKLFHKRFIIVYILLDHLCTSVLWLLDVLPSCKSYKRL